VGNRESGEDFAEQDAGRRVFVGTAAGCNVNVFIGAEQV
jgi:hypothetical protein